MSALSGLHGSVFSLLLLAGLAVDKLVYSHKIHSPPRHPPANGAVSTFAGHGSEERFAAVTLVSLGSKTQHALNGKSGEVLQSLFQQISSSARPPNNSSTSSDDSAFESDSTSNSPSESARLTKASSLHGMHPDYVYKRAPLTPYVPIQSANAPIYVSNSEETKTNVPELWGQGFRSLVSTGGWQNLFALPERWKLQPGILRGSYSAPEPFIGIGKPQRTHVVETSGKEGVSHTNKLWRTIRTLQLWFSHRMLPSSSASPTTCILCVLLVVYLYLLFRLVLLCGRLQHAQRRMLPVLRSTPPCASLCSPQQQGLPSSALLIGSHSTYCSDSVETTVRRARLASGSFDIKDYGARGSEGPRENWCTVRNSTQLLGRLPAASASHWQWYTALRRLRHPHTCTRSLQRDAWSVQRAESVRNLKGWRQPKGDVVSLDSEERTHTPRSKSKQPQEHQEQEQLVKREQKDGEVTENECETDFLPCKIAAEKREDLPPDRQAAYVILCYPGVWRATAYNPYLLESSMCCVTLSSKVQQSSWNPPHKTREHRSSTEVKFCDKQQPTLSGEGAMHLAATYVSQRSFTWWKTYLAMCCGCTCCLLVLSIYCDVEHLSSVDTSTGSHKHCSFPSHAHKDHYSRSCALTRTTSLSSLFHAGENKSVLSATGAVVALLQWLASLCLLRACLGDCSQSTMRRQGMRSKAKAEAAAVALSLLYVFFVLCLVPSLFSASPLVRSSRSLPTIYDSQHVPAHAREWHNQQDGLWLANFLPPQPEEYRPSNTRRDTPAVDETARRKDTMVNVVEVEGGAISRPKDKNIANYGRPSSSFEVGEKQDTLATGQLQAAIPSKSVNYTAGDDMSVTREQANKRLESEQHSSDTQEPVPPRVPMQQQRRSVSASHEKQLKMYPNLQQQQIDVYEKRPHGYDSRRVHGRNIGLIITVGIMLLSLCHAVPRLWALYAVFKLIREDDVFIVRRNSRAKPSFTALAWGVGFSLVDLLPLPCVSHYLQVRCAPWEVFPVCGIDLLFCVQGVHVYLLFAHARREILTREDSALLKRAISSMQQTFQLNVFR